MVSVGFGAADESFALFGFGLDSFVEVISGIGVWYMIRACLYLSVILLGTSAGYELTGIGSLDALGALGIAWFALREGREVFSKARGVVLVTVHQEW
jgi:divalent metal cation (Fe/Co/Zn/Cd) transporter